VYDTDALGGGAVSGRHYSRAQEDRARRVAHLREVAAYLKKTTKAFEKIAARGEIPKHYLTERGILFSQKELD
jgi:hypothetical protein